ncbi:class I adenylate-forming enzyme family protein [Kocuria sabuli]|uniref:class I adenylate-forming enzyme family protein n=1 Tax=Kocuria sabuli TaxID=3071448 RepID=UPI0034D4253B
MPFLDRVARWAEERPEELAVVCGAEQLSWRALVARAAALAASGAPSGVLRQGNGTDFAVRWAAGVAGDRECAVLDPLWPAGPAGAVLRRAARRLPAAPAPARLRDGDPASSFLIGLTSGTTAVPKGFRRSRDSWRRSFEASVEHFGLGADDRVLAPGPLSASLNLYALSECLYAGAGFATLPRFDVAAAHAEITGRGITRLVVVPAALRVLAERGLAAGVDAGGLTAIVCAGQKLDRRTEEAARRWAPRATLWEYYGAAELGFVAARRRGPGQPAAAPGTGVGAAFPGVELAVLDDDGRPVPEGTPGTVCVRSRLVCDGYLWGDDGRAFGELGGMATVRDRGFLRDGQLHVLGRSADMVVTGGHNVYPQEVEAAVAAVPGVADAVVTGMPDGARGQRVVAGVVPAHGRLSRRRLQDGVASALAPAKRPRHYVALDELPLTGSGKLSRGLFRDWVLDGDRRVRPLG